jgi:hypothetical protein
MLSILRLIWDEWNIKHIARHNIIPDEVEQVCHGDPFPEKGKKGRVRITGPTISGRMLAIILDPEKEPGIYYPVTARPVSRKELRAYELAKGGE